MFDPTLTPVYDWHKQIRPELCRRIGIEEQYFREYHKLCEPNTSYRDFWHVCLKTIIPEEMGNDSIVMMFRCDEEFIEEYLDGTNDWKTQVLYAWNELYDELDTSEYKENGIWVHFSW